MHIFLLTESKAPFHRWEVSRVSQVTENRNPNTDEPTRQVDPGENPVIMNPGTVSAVDIAILAVEWRWKVEEHERETPVDKNREERALETRRKMRRLRWDADWANYRSIHQGEVLNKNIGSYGRDSGR